MPAKSLNHYTIMARDLEATKNFYTDVVGLTVGDARRSLSPATGCTAAACRRCTARLPGAGRR